MPEIEPLTLDNHSIGPWNVSTIELPGAKRSFAVYVDGTIINSVTENAKALRGWKERVMAATKQRRGTASWDPRSRFAITLTLKFCPKKHGGQRKLDVDNFTKPIIDGVAAGLFCGPETEPSQIDAFDYDDSNFNTLLIHRLPDTDNRDQEGVAIYVSAT